MSKIYECLMPFRTANRRYLWGEPISHPEYRRLSVEHQANFKEATR